MTQGASSIYNSVCVVCLCYARSCACIVLLYVSARACVCCLLSVVCVCVCVSPSIWLSLCACLCLHACLRARAYARLPVRLCSFECAYVRVLTSPNASHTCNTFVVCLVLIRGRCVVHIRGAYVRVFICGYCKCCSSGTHMRVLICGACICCSHVVWFIGQRLIPHLPQLPKVSVGVFWNMIFMYVGVM